MAKETPMPREPPLELRVEPGKCEAFFCDETIQVGQCYVSPYGGHYHSEQCYRDSLED